MSISYSVKLVRETSSHTSSWQEILLGYFSTNDGGLLPCELSGMHQTFISVFMDINSFRLPAVTKPSYYDAKDGLADEILLLSTIVRVWLCERWLKMVCFPINLICIAFVLKILRSYRPVMRICQHECISYVYHTTYTEMLSRSFI